MEASRDGGVNLTLTPVCITGSLHVVKRLNSFPDLTTWVEADCCLHQTVVIL